MRKDQIIERQAQGLLSAVLVLPNPAQVNEWILLFKERQGHSHFLLSEQDNILSFISLEDAIAQLRDIGCKRAEIQL